ncbi:MAG: LamG-like jellyroll fold domain-containing protein [Bacteroidales bacterium]
MKKKNLLFTAIAILSFATTTIAQLPSYVPTNGLIGYWPFNGNANDITTNANNGTVYGSTLTNDRFGNNGAAYYFNGNSYISIQNSALFHFGTNTNFTTNIWFKRASTSSAWKVLMAYACPNGIPSGFQLGTTSNFNLELGTTNAEIYTGGSINDTSWHMLSAAFDRQIDSVIIYQDGQYLGCIFVNNNQSYTPTCNSNILIGGERNNWTQYYFNGSIDDIGFWNRVLTPAEISGLYNGNLCYQYITVTDTLVINTNISGFSPITYQNTIKVWPNPTKDHITIDNGNIANMVGYQLKITNSLGQQVFQSAINQQQFYVDLASWTGNGIYFVYIINGQGQTIDIKKIVLQ